MMTNSADFIRGIEQEVDETFATSRLLDTGFAQAAWTLLSMNEDAYLKAIHTLSGEELHIFADSHLNALTYPLRACLERCSIVGRRVQTELISEHYQLAWDWLRAADDYAQFCSIFPLCTEGESTYPSPKIVWLQITAQLPTDVTKPTIGSFAKTHVHRPKSFRRMTP
ncbi:hypothetical protein IVA86_28405 [Bradyrhizobium sp. 146]|uniref:hypothetical protein n=1 Tax=Bradyrhizobium sp. 146 TaxID=2782622 RepID=UPI001FF9A3E3|nr:hypothetical protein [Bradyrhizobium sp. 146]MCK1705221.1 hypothetical protein [Bradyrhizobium sp. 146]